MVGRQTLRFLAATLVVGLAHAAHADDGGLKDGIPDPSIATSLPGNGDPGGHRKALAERGITYGINYVGDLFGNATGGERRGTTYMGRLEGFVDADLEKLAGLKGLYFHANAYQIHGHGLSREYIGNLFPVVANEALATTKLFELWLEQKLLDNAVSVKFGQLAADVDFITSSWAGQFVGNTFGWPTLAATNLPSGGPAFPFTTPGVRVRVDPSQNITMLVGLYNGDPAGPGTGDPERRNRYGVRFPIDGPPLLIGELQYRYNQDKKASGGAGTLKLGAFHHFGSFDDTRYDTNGVPLAVNINGVPATHRGNTGIYGVIDQQIWRPASGEPDKGIGVFLRALGAPDDRNLLDLYIDGGIVFAGLVPGRPDDIFGFGAAYGRIADGARGFDRDNAAFQGLPLPVRTFEAAIEANYMAQVIPGWTVGVDFQYIFNPGGHIANPRSASPTEPIGDAAVFGLHTAIKY